MSNDFYRSYEFIHTHNPSGVSLGKKNQKKKKAHVKLKIYSTDSNRRLFRPKAKKDDYCHLLDSSLILISSVHIVRR